tara:strand:- start:264 stop:860 length:597 start_codon:yes stop_codon:yes gene_type:complete
MQKIFYLIVILFLSSCGKDMFTFPSAKDVPIDVNERVEKNIEEGRGISFGGPKRQGGVFDFASSNEMWRASIEVLDFVSFTNASYSGGIIITDWFSGNNKDEETKPRELKITVRFLSNEIRADGLKVIVHEKLCSSIDKSDCQIQKIESEITNQIKLAILKKASIFKEQGDRANADSVRKYRKGSKNKKVGKTPKDYN